MDNNYKITIYKIKKKKRAVDVLVDRILFCKFLIFVLLIIFIFLSYIIN